MKIWYVYVCNGSPEISKILKENSFPRMEQKIWRSPYPQNQKPMFHLKQLILLCNGMPPPESKVRMNYNKIPRYLSIRGLHCQIRITG